jgi:DNA-binding MarR family transcriptional regulator
MTEDPQTDSGQLTGDLGFRLSRLARQLRADWGDRIATLGLTQPQAAVLRALCERGDLGLRELARLIGADPSNLRREIDRLVGDGLIIVDDIGQRGRKVTLSLTTEGSRLTNEVIALGAEHAQSTIGQLSPSDHEALAVIVGQLEAVLGIDQKRPEES